MTTTRWILVAAVLAIALAVAWSARPGPLTAAERVDRISAELRCPVCQGLSVQDSPSETARSMKDLVATRVAEGRTDDEIRAEFQRSYGLDPPLAAAARRQRPRLARPARCDRRRCAHRARSDAGAGAAARGRRAVH